MTIPKIIHHIWIQGYDAVPEHHKKNIEKLQSLNPEYEYYCWSEEDIRNILETSYPQLVVVFEKIPTLIGKENPLSVKSDLGRYVLMKEYGGFYLDIDITCSGSLNDLLAGFDRDDTIFVASSEVKILTQTAFLRKFTQKYCSAFMAFPPHHFIWDAVFAYIEKATWKSDIGSGLDKMLQKNKLPLDLVILEKKVKGPYACNKDSCTREDQHVCVIPTESSWNKLRPAAAYFNCHYAAIMWSVFAVVLSIIIVVVVIVVVRKKRRSRLKNKKG